MTAVGSRVSCRRRCGSDQGDDKIAAHRDSRYLVGFLNLELLPPASKTFGGSGHVSNITSWDHE
jgi:hypothetical protein